MSNMVGAWTNNWRNMKRAWATGVTGAAVGPIVSIENSMVSGFYMQAVMSTPLMPIAYNTTGINAVSVTVRFGGVETTAPTPGEDDYNIYLPVLSGIEYEETLNGSITYDPETGIASRFGSVTIRNKQSDVKRFGEWGLFGGVPYSYGSNSYRTAEVLLYRAVFNEPIELAHNETLTLSFTRRMQIDVPNSGT